MNRILVLLLICISTTSLAQKKSTDSLYTDRNQDIKNRVTDTVLIESYAKRYNPRKALLYAAVLPGLGQVYTKKYWKLPLIYGGIGATAYSINFYEKKYTEYKSLLFDRLNGLPSPYSEELLRNAINRVRRQRDFMIIIMGLVYVLQIVDAHVDAHLKEFDLNPNLQVNLRPIIESDPLLGRQTGLALTIKF